MGDEALQLGWLGWDIQALGDNSRPIQLPPSGKYRSTDQGTLMTDLPSERKLIFSEEKNVDLIYFTGCESPLERRSSV